MGQVASRKGHASYQERAELVIAPDSRPCDSLSVVADLLPRYLALEQNGKAQGLAASADLSRVQGLSDQEMIDAIQALNRSTDAINKQTETLRQQQNAVSRLITASGKTGDARSDLEVKRLYEWESSRKALHTSVSPHFELIINSLLTCVSGRAPVPGHRLSHVRARPGNQGIWQRLGKCC